MLECLVSDDRDCGNFPGLRQYENLPLGTSEMKDYNANQGSLAGNGNEYNKDDYQRDRGITMKDQHRSAGGLFGRHENGISAAKSKIEINDKWEKEASDKLKTLVPEPALIGSISLK